jgi:hypothetical protein
LLENFNGTTKIKARLEHFLKPHIACPIPGHFIDPCNFQANIFGETVPLTLEYLSKFEAKFVIILGTVSNVQTGS